MTIIDSDFYDDMKLVAKSCPEFSIELQMSLEAIGKKELIEFAKELGSLISFSCDGSQILTPFVNNLKQVDAYVFDHALPILTREFFDVYRDDPEKLEFCLNARRLMLRQIFSKYSAVLGEAGSI